jgi:hypothetical protein
MRGLKITLIFTHSQQIYFGKIIEVPIHIDKNSPAFSSVAAPETQLQHKYHLGLAAPDAI